MFRGIRYWGSLLTYRFRASCNSRRPSLYMCRYCWPRLSFSILLCLLSLGYSPRVETECSAKHSGSWESRRAMRYGPSPRGCARIKSRHTNSFSPKPRHAHIHSPDLKQVLTWYILILIRWRSFPAGVHQLRWLDPSDPALESSALSRILRRSCVSRYT